MFYAWPRDNENKRLNECLDHPTIAEVKEAAVINQ